MNPRHLSSLAIALLLLVGVARECNSATPEEVLEKKTDIQFRFTPVGRAAEFMSDLYRVPFVVADGVNENVKLNYEAENKILKDALTEMLKPHQLTYKVVGNEIRIEHKKE